MGDNRYTGTSGNRFPGRTEATGGMAATLIGDEEAAGRAGCGSQLISHESQV